MPPKQKVTSSNLVGRTTPSPTPSKANPAPPLSTLTPSAVFAATGGLLDAFTYINHGHVFANSMTGNVVLLGVNLIAGQTRHSLRHLFPILSFFLGVAAARALYLPGIRSVIGEPARAAITLEIAILAALGFLPATAPDFPITICVAFAASVQTSTFRSVEGTPYSSTFTTGNLRTLSESAFAWLFYQDRLASGRMMRVFATICAAFLAGAVIGSILAPLLHNRTLWVVCLPLASLWLYLMKSPASGPAN